jgi:hypothetical protein
LLFAGDVWAESRIDARPLLVRHLLPAEAAAGDLRDLVARDPAKALDQPRHIEAREPD